MYRSALMVMTSTFVTTVIRIGFMEGAYSPREASFPRAITYDGHTRGFRMIFPSKVDAWIATVGVLALAAVGWSAVTVALPAPSLAAAAATLGAMLFPLVVVALVALPTQYELHPDELVVRSGVIRYRTRYADV